MNNVERDLYKNGYTTEYIPDSLWGMHTTKIYKNGKIRWWIYETSSRNAITNKEKVAKRKKYIKQYIIYYVNTIW